MAGQEEVSSRPEKIGIIDSGVGGLSVLKEIRALLPAHPIHYIGDSAWCPYGNKSAEVICDRVTQLTDYLLEQEIDILVIACNSATIHAVGTLRATYPIPIVGMEPAVKPASELTESGVVAVLATEASIAGEKFHRLVDRHARPKGVKVITQPCPRFVELVESGILEGSEVDRAVREIVDPLLASKADVFVLGCTHYPFLRSAIEAALPDSVEVIDTGPPVARQVKSFLSSEANGTGEIVLETTGELEVLEALLPGLLGSQIPVERIGICSIS